jgi:co-chaperonin GroES (HSP10)
MKRPVWHPMPGKIIVEPLREERVNGLWLPDGSDTSRSMGTVIAIGGDESDGDEYILEVGDLVVYSRTSGVKIRVGNQDVVCFRTAEILTRITWAEDEEADG